MFQDDQETVLLSSSHCSYETQKRTQWKPVRVANLVPARTLSHSSPSSANNSTSAKFPRPRAVSRLLLYSSASWILSANTLGQWTVHRLCQRVGSWRPTCDRVLKDLLLWPVVGSEGVGVCLAVRNKWPLVRNRDGHKAAAVRSGGVGVGGAGGRWGDGEAAGGGETVWQARRSGVVGASTSTLC